MSQHSIQRVLVPIDFTKRSMNVLTHITKICDPKKHHFILYHSYARSNTDVILISVKDIIENEIKHKLEKEAQYLKSQTLNNDLSFEIKVDKGELLSTMKKGCIRDHIDLIALGSKKWNFLEIG